MLLKITPDREDVVIARFAALAIGIHVLESLLPSPVPGIKPGFANIITLLVFMAYGFSAASWVSILRVVVGSLIVGTFLSPTFVLSFSGAIVSLLMLYWCDRFNRLFAVDKLSIFSLAILMSMAHMATQFLIVYVFFIPHKALLDILPVMMTAALVFGAINGVIARKVHKAHEVRIKSGTS
ncbi:MAG: Gx transporter family protein [Gammaproteobacteria bacterium]|nr:Gx transporter family protein [Gammaproteobacteria bacterium]